jgi:hypothetical protein
MPVVSNATTAENFWRWFIENEANFLVNDTFHANHGDALTAELRKVHPDLVWEVSIKPDGVSDFIISGDGLRDMIPVVKALVGTARNLDHWNVIAFRPRVQNFARLDLTYEGRLFDPKKIWFHPIVDGEFFDVIFFHPDFDIENDRDLIISGTYILLDMALGELDVMTGTRFIDHQRLLEDPASVGLLPFSSLRDVFDSHVGSAH